MKLFEPRINRDLAVQLGEEAVAISKAGRYVGPAGPVDIAAGVKACVQALKDIGYEGYVSAEVLPLPDSESAARQTMESFRKWFPR